MGATTEEKAQFVKSRKLVIYLFVKQKVDNNLIWLFLVSDCVQICSMASSATAIERSLCPIKIMDRGTF